MQTELDVLACHLETEVLGIVKGVKIWSSCVILNHFKHLVVAAMIKEERLVLDEDSLDENGKGLRTDMGVALASNPPL